MSTALHRFKNPVLAQPAEVKGQTDVRGAHDSDDLLENAYASVRRAKHAAAIAHHRVVVQMAEHALIHRIVRCQVQRRQGKAALAMPMLDHFAARFGVAGADVNRIHGKNIFVFRPMPGVAQRR